jgi:hypothetical protein
LLLVELVVQLLLVVLVVLDTQLVELVRTVHLTVRRAAVAAVLLQ